MELRRLEVGPTCRVGLPGSPRPATLRCAISKISPPDRSGWLGFSWILRTHGFALRRKSFPAERTYRRLSFPAEWTNCAEHYWVSPLFRPASHSIPYLRHLLKNVLRGRFSRRAARALFPDATRSASRSSISSDSAELALPGSATMSLPFASFRDTLRTVDVAARFIAGRCGLAG